MNVNVSEIAFFDVEFGTCIVLLSCRCIFCVFELVEIGDPCVCVCSVMICVF